MQLAGPGTIVVCAGGGTLHGVEAVVDKDRTASLLARVLAADVLLILTDVDAVEGGYGRSAPRWQSRTHYPLALEWPL